MPSVRIDLPNTDAALMAPNKRPHWRVARRESKHIRTVVALWAQSKRIPTGLTHVTVECHLQPMRRMDQDNVRGCGLWKAAIDGLHDHRGRANGAKWPVVADDSDVHMSKPDPVQHEPGKTREAWLIVTWNDEETKK